MKEVFLSYFQNLFLYPCLVGSAFIEDKRALRIEKFRMRCPALYKWRTGNCSDLSYVNAAEHVRLLLMEKII
jgi:hypothetical protein